MRMKMVTGLVVALMTGMVSGAIADVIKGEVMIAPRGSLGIPVGDYPITGRDFSDLKNKVKTGYAFGALVDKVLTERVSVGAEVGYNVSKMNTTDLSNRLKQQGYDIEPDFKWKTIQLTGHARYHVLPTQSLSFFGHLGAGLYVNKFSTDYVQHGTGDVTVLVPSSQTFTNFGINAGPGLLLRTGPYTRLSLEAIIHNVFTPKQSTRYLNVTASLVFSIPPE